MLDKHLNFALKLTTFTFKLRFTLFEGEQYEVIDFYQTSSLTCIRKHRLHALALVYTDGCLTMLLPR